MELLKCHDLSSNQRKEVSNLVTLCQSFEKTTISFPVDDSDTIYLLYDNQNLVSCLSLFFPDQENCECCAFTHPGYRRRGHFSALLSEAAAMLEEMEENTGLEICLCFLTDGKAPSALHTLKALEAGYWYSEYMMVLPLEGVVFAPSKKVPEHTGGPCLRLSLHSHSDSCPDIEQGWNPAEDLALLLKSCDCVSCQILDPLGSLAGKFMLSGPGPDTVYFYGFEICDGLRGKGYGTQALCQLIGMLAKNQIKNLSLQVSEQNKAAVELYKKTGFQITETLSYYVY